MIGSRQRRLIDALAEAERAGKPYPSVNALASAVGDKPWETSANSESLRLLIRKGFVRLDPDHPDAQSWGNGVPVLTDEGRALLSEVD